jgi:hypothetical protein
VIRVSTRVPSVVPDAFGVLLALVVAVVGAFYAVGFGGFWLGDDFANITNFHDLEQQGRLLRGTLAYFATGLSPTGSFYRPFSMVSLAANYAVAGVAYPGWYLVGFAVHLANIVLVALVARRLALACEGNATWSAPLAALLFGLAPMLAEGVYWQSARADGWVTLLSLLAVHTWVGPGRGPWLLLPLLAVALAFKESAALLPVQLALLAWALPGKRSRAQWATLLLAFVLMTIFMGWRAYLFGHAWHVYVAPAAAASGLDWSTLTGAVVSVAPWWMAMMAVSSTASPLYLCLVGATLALAVIAVADSRARAWVALALVCASGGMIFATLLNLGGLAPSGEGGRLAYGPFAWLALVIGVACSRAPGAKAATSSAGVYVASLGSIVVASMVGGWILAAVLDQARGAQDNVRALIRALPAWADAHDGLTLLIVPERIGPIVVARNGQASLVMPPFQSRPFLHRVLPTLPAEIGTRYEQLDGGLAVRLAERPPQRMSTDILLRLSQPATARWPDHYACWSRDHRQMIEMTTPRTATELTWSDDLRDAVRTACGSIS